MTVAEMREYAATEIMGWYQHDHGYQREFAYHENPGLFRVWTRDWLPDQDRNQLEAVMARIRETCAVLDKPFTTTRTERGELEVWCCIDSIAMREPHKALALIVKAHKETK